VPSESLGVVSYLPSIVTMAVSVAVCELFSVKACDLGNWVKGRSRLRCSNEAGRLVEDNRDVHLGEFL